MGLVVDIHWNCPGCGEKNYSQSYGDWDDSREGYHHTSVPLHNAIDLKWNKPCTKCGQYKLEEPPCKQRVSMGFKKIEYDEE